MQIIGGQTLAAREFPQVRFHKTMQKVIPWSALEAKLKPHYFPGKRGRSPFPLELMLRLYLLALLHNYSDDQVLYEGPIGTGSETGRVHATDCTTARVHDSQVLGCLLHGDEHEVYGDKAYVGQGETIQEVAPEATDKTLAKAYRNRPLTAAQEESNRAKNRVRAKVEHRFRVLKCQFKYRRVRVRGLERNTFHIRKLMSLVNLYQFRHQLLAAG